MPCAHDASQQGAKAALKFARSPVHAWGMFAKEAIEEGALVCEYVGEEIRKEVTPGR